MSLRLLSVRVHAKPLPSLYRETLTGLALLPRMCVVIKMISLRGFKFGSVETGGGTQARAHARACRQGYPRATPHEK